MSEGERPLSLEEVKSHLRVSGEEFDGNLGLLLDAAVARAERVTGRVLRKSTWRLSGSFSPRVATGLLPIRRVTAKVDGRDVEATWDEDRVFFPPEAAGERVELSVEAGYEELPADLKAALLLMTGKLFDNPADPVENLPKASTHILRNYTVWGEEGER